MLAALASGGLLLGGWFLAGQQDFYIRQDGQIIAVEAQEGTTIPITVTGSREGTSASRQVHITIREEEADTRPPSESVEATLERQLTEVLRRLDRKENQYQGRLPLPATLQDGTQLTWEAPGNNRFWMLAGLPFLLVFYRRRGEVDRAKKKRKALERSFVTSLPGFNHEILLLLETGAVFTDAFQQVTDSYRAGKTPTLFQQEMLRHRREAERTNRECVDVLMEASGKLQIRAFTRITGILADHQYKGSDLREKLQAEGHLLWEARKQSAEDAGKRVEVALAGPMAILLLVLVVLTAAPALLEMT